MLYDGNGYNQDGFHRDTGLNCRGLTRLQDQARRREAAGPHEDLIEYGEQQDRQRGDHEWGILRSLTIDSRKLVNSLEEGQRDIVLNYMRVYLLRVQRTILGDPRDDFVDDSHSDPDGDFENEANPWPEIHGDGDVHPNEVWPAETRPPATPITRPPSPLGLPVVGDRPPLPPDTEESSQSASEGDGERPDWFPSTGGWPENEEL